MNIAALGGAIPATAPISNNRTGEVIEYAKIMTADDKALFKAAAGYDIGAPGHNEVPHLAVAISLARATGFLQGPVTVGFLKQYSGDPMMGNGVIQKALAYLDSRLASASGRAGHTVSYDA